MKNSRLPDLSHALPTTGRFALRDQTRFAPSKAEALITRLFADADVTVNGSRPWDIKIKDARFFRRVLGGGTLAFGEAYMDGWWECDAIDELSCRLLGARVDQRLERNFANAWAVFTAKLFNLQSVRRSRAAVHAHYDIGNDFFAAMLDPTLQYSCAYFSATDDLATAQQQKLDLICRKLALKPGMRLLDIGCGWGGLARHAARHYGSDVVGITLSAEQRAYAIEASAGLSVEFRLQDYRDLADKFDRVVSVGMMEHVGYKNYATYMDAAASCLDKGGIFLCHSIGGNTSHVSTDPWLNRYIFPGSMVPSPAQVTHAAEGRFVLEDVHNFGPYYDLTLIAWERNFQEAWPRFRATYGDRFGRMWRYYLLSSAGAFRARHVELFQFVLSKGGVPGGYTAVR